MNEPAAPTPLEIFLTVLLIPCLLVSAWFSLVYINQPIVEAHSFRQTQTAITSYYLMQNGFSLHYWTPIVGESWSIPFEFPIYQEVVALVSSTFHMPLEACGRFVSWVFLLLCCLPLNALLRRLAVSDATRLFTLALFLTSPLYLFWGSTFMIESTALFFTLCFCHFASSLLLEKSRPVDYIAASVFLTLAALQKATTGMPPALVFLAAVTIINLRRHGLASSIRPLARALAVILPPIIIVLLWTHYTDQVKQANPAAQQLMTMSALKEWNYGSLGQRLSGSLWIDTVWSRVFQQNAGGILGVIALVACLMTPAPGRIRAIIAILLSAGLLPFLLFTNLHIVHTYYQSANVVFVILAVGIAVFTASEHFLARYPAAIGLVAVAFIAWNLVSFHSSYMDTRTKSITEDNDFTLRLTSFVKNATAPDDVVMWLGFGWSSEPAFYSERKALTLPPDNNIDIDGLVNPGKYLSKPPALIVLCPNPNGDLEMRTLMKLYPQLPAMKFETCAILFTKPQRTGMPAG